MTLEFCAMMTMKMGCHWARKLAFHLQAQAEQSLSSSVQCLYWCQASLGCLLKDRAWVGNMRSCFLLLVLLSDIYVFSVLRIYRCMCVCVSVRPCMYLCMLVNTSASAAAHVYVYVCFKKRHDFCLSVCLSFCLSTCLSVCLSVDMHAQGASDMGFCMPAIRHACLDRWMDGRMFVCVHVCRLFCWFI